jgi:hypothetical protein
VLVTLDEAGFMVEPLAEEAACTPFTVAAHMLYENADPFRLREPDGVLDTTDATYQAVDDRRVRVEGSRFDVLPPTIKLEGAAPAGYQTMIVAGMRNPKVLSRIDAWCDGVLGYLHGIVRTRLGLGDTDYDLRLLRYGHDAVLGDTEPLRNDPPREIGLVFFATAAGQATATEIAKLANPILLYAPLPTETAMPSYAFLGSPAEIERGQIHEFVLCHAVDVDDTLELFRTELAPKASMTPTVGDLGELIRSKNAGPFWLTVDIFCDEDDAFRRLARSPLTDPGAIAEIYSVPADQVRIFAISSLRAIKISFPRPVPQGSAGDRDMHGGQQYVSLLALEVA